MLRLLWLASSSMTLGQSYEYREVGLGSYVIATGFGAGLAAGTVMAMSAGLSDGTIITGMAARRVSQSFPAGLSAGAFASFAAGIEDVL